MKITVCNNCGLTMHSGAVKVCPNCNQKNLAYHDMYCGGDSITFHKRVDELGARHRKKITNYSNPLVSALLVLVVTTCVYAVVDYGTNPGGTVAMQAHKLAHSLSQPAASGSRVAAKKPSSKSL